MCGPYSEPHLSNCTCKECLPDPSYWNGVDPEWHKNEITIRNQSSRFDTPYDGDAAAENDPQENKTNKRRINARFVFLL